MDEFSAIFRRMVGGSGSVWQPGVFDVGNSACERRIFTERFPQDLIQAHARRTSRLDVLTHAIALALGGRPGERLAGRLSMPVGADTLLRLLRRRAVPSPSDVRVVGIDDFAWLKGQRYGTIICDLERRCTIDLLPDRESGTVADWLAAHPGIEIVCCYRGSGYREGATMGASSLTESQSRFGDSIKWPTFSRRGAGGEHGGRE